MSLEWASFAVRLDGPGNKHGYGGDERALREGAVYHSMEGSIAVALRMLANPALTKSWTFSNPKQGQLIQHYAVGKHAWANGSQESNEKFVACENEGVAGEPLTDSQVDNLVELTVWLYATQEWTTLTRLITCWEHQEMTRFGSRPTACPSGRIPWADIIAQANEITNGGDTMTTYKLFQTWNPAQLWLICYVFEVPIYRRWITTQAGAQILTAALEEPETISETILELIPAL